MNDTRNRRILAIDDNPDIHEDYRKVLAVSAANDLDEFESVLFGETIPVDTSTNQESWEIDSAFQGQEGLAMVQEAVNCGRPYAVSFVDIRMPPGWDGVETVQRIWEVDPDLPIVLCTAYSDHTWDEIVRRLDRPDQFLILKKPFENIELRQLVASQSEKWRRTRLTNQKFEQLEELVSERTKELVQTRDIMFYTLARLAESRDAETGDHLKRMQRYTRILAEWLRCNGPYQDQIDRQFVEDIYRSSVLHDLGKVATPDSVLLKPGKLTPEEFEIMKQHVTVGADALDEAAQLASCCSFLRMSAEIARYHHEKFDGTGYPQQISGLDIPLSARIVAVADVFDAMTTDRRYRRAIDKDEVRKTMNGDSGTHFDPAVIEAFNACWEQFRNLEGSLVSSESRFFPNSFPAVELATTSQT